MADHRKVFLSAEWLNLVLLNYVVDPSLLRSHIPFGTSLDSFEGKTYVSLVGFRFSKTKLWRTVSVPFHTEFEEVNLRFYVRRRIGGELRRGVAFLREIVPKPAIALTARLVYGENYVWLPMKHKIIAATNHKEVEYSWEHRGNWSRLSARSSEGATRPAENSLEQYITEHYWGYARQTLDRTLEYHVRHSPWPVSVASEASFSGHTSELCGSEFQAVLSGKPDSAYLSSGSPVEVYSGVVIR